MSMKKVCTACNTELDIDKFSKLQWKLPDCGIGRRCKECVAQNRPNGTAHLVEMTKRYSPSITHNEDVLFSNGLQSATGECQVCFLELSSNREETRINTCCAKPICNGCSYSAYLVNMNFRCAFCRTPLTDNPTENARMLQERVDAGDPSAMTFLARSYKHGRGVAQSDKKHMFLLYKAVEQGSIDAHEMIGMAYTTGEGVEQDSIKAAYHFGEAAMAGHANARHNLGVSETNMGNYTQGLRHFKISAQMGFEPSLHSIRRLLSSGLATKEDYSRALVEYKAATARTDSDQRRRARNVERSPHE